MKYFSMRGCARLLSALGVVALVVMTLSATAKAAYDYSGKRIDFVVPFPTAGGSDVWARFFAPRFQEALPGNPVIAVRNVPGGGSVTGANQFAERAKPDGLSIGAVGNILVSGPILDLPGSKYDLDRLIYLGSTESGRPTALGTRREAGLDSLEKLRAATGVRIGAHAVGHITYVTGRMFAYLLGMKDPRFVVGYSAPERDLELIRGEIDASTMSPATIQQHPELLQKVHLHVVVNIPQGKHHPVYPPGLPEIDSVAKTEQERGLLELYRAFLYPRWPYFLPPGTPKELVDILREAMAKAFEDPGFVRDFKKLTGSDPTPLTGAEVEEAIRKMPRDPEVIALYKKLADSGPLPLR